MRELQATAGTPLQAVQTVRFHLSLAFQPLTEKGRCVLRMGALRALLVYISAQCRVQTTIALG